MSAAATRRFWSFPPGPRQVESRRKQKIVWRKPSKLRQHLLDDQTVIVIDVASPEDVFAISIHQQPIAFRLKFIFDLEQSPESTRLHEPDGALEWAAKDFHPFQLPRIDDRAHRRKNLVLHLIRIIQVHL